MNESQSLGVEGLSWQNFETIANKTGVFGINGTLADLIAVVAVIIEKRMAYIIHMHPDLMGTPCFKHTFHHSHESETFQHPVMGNRSFALAAVRKNLESEPVSRVPADIALDGTLILGYVAPDHRHVFSLYGMDKKLFCKVQLCLVIFRHHQQS